MAQGIAYTAEQRETIINSLKPYLEMGLSRNRACALIGLKPQTLSLWVREDEALLMRMKGWENAMNVLATANIKSAMEREAEDDVQEKKVSLWWAERRMKDDYSTKTETDVSVKEMPVPLLNTLDVLNNDSNQKGIESQ